MKKLIFTTIGCFMFFIAFACPGQEHDEKRRCHKGKKNPFRGLNLNTIQSFRRFDLNQDGELSQAEFLSIEISQQVLRVSGKDRVHEIFKSIDKDSSDSICLSELAKSQHSKNVRIMDPETASRFHELDQNYDGLIDWMEYEVASAIDRETAREEFGKMDLNENGIIGSFEFVQSQPDERKHLMTRKLAERFAKIDQNNDSAISREEYSESPIAILVKKKGSPEKIEGMFNRIDQNGNGEISPGEYARFQDSICRSGVDKMSLDYFAKLDRNKDGAISRREYSKSPFARSTDSTERVDKVFQRIDRNNDNELSLKEYADRFKTGRFHDRSSQ